MKLTKEQLAKIIKEEYANVKESWQQKMFGGEEEIIPPSEPAPASKESESWKTLERLVRATNKEFPELNLGFPLLRKFYKLHRAHGRQDIGWRLPKITQIIPMEGGRYDIVFADGTQEVYQDRFTDRGHRGSAFRSTY